MRTLAFAIVLTLAGCATPDAYTAAPMRQYDRNTDYVVEPTVDGFTLTVVYGRYQMIPETSALLVSCKSQLTAIAHELAEKQGRRIQPIDDQRIRISTGRNAFSGITSCSANAKATYQ